MFQVITRYYPGSTLLPCFALISQLVNATAVTLYRSAFVMTLADGWPRTKQQEGDDEGTKLKLSLIIWLNFQTTILQFPLYLQRHKSELFITCSQCNCWLVKRPRLCAHEGTVEQKKGTDKVRMNIRRELYSIPIKAGPFDIGIINVVVCKLCHLLHITKDIQHRLIFTSTPIARIVTLKFKI